MATAGALPRTSIALLSAAALGYEVLLMRLFSIIQWHHFAYMIISLALLGYGVSGSFLALAAPRLKRHFAAIFVSQIALFATTALGAFLLGQALPFNPQALFWEPGQGLYLLLLYLLLSLPFFFAANAIGLALYCHRTEISRLYGADMAGAGLGSLAIIGLMYLVLPMQALLILSLFGLATALYACHELGLGRGPRRALLALAAILALLSPQLALHPSPYKGLSQALQISGSRIVEQHSSPLGLLSVVENERVPLRHAPGLSLMAHDEPPPQVGVFQDADSLSVITRYGGERGSLGYLDQLTSALPYHLQPPGRVLILGAGGGSDVLQALYHDTQQIDAVELNPQLASLVKDEYGSYGGRLYERPGVSLHIGEARGFVRHTTGGYDLIQLSMLDAYGAASAGLHALSETYLYTTEALGDYLGILNRDGMLAISRWLRLPPRDSLKLFATAVAALRQQGYEAPGQHLVMIRSWQTTTLVVKKGRFSAAEIARLKAFCQARLFDLAYYPGMAAIEANRHNLLQQPYLYQGAVALLGAGAEGFLDDYKFNLRPASDDRPYFFNFFKWRALPELLGLRGRGGMALLEFGYLLLVATLLQALLASVVLILLPLLLWRGRGQSLPRHAGRPLLYFLCLGLAFLFLEIAFMQSFTRFLHHPLYAVTVVLAAFLLFAGLGSHWSRRFEQGRGRAIRRAILAIAALGLLYLMLLGPLLDALLSLPMVLKIVITVALVAPLAFCMGLPFPLGLQLWSEGDERLLPWCWGVNGCASVLSAVLATLLAIHLGFSWVIALGLLIYLGAAALVREGSPA